MTSIVVWTEISKNTWAKETFVPLPNSSSWYRTHLGWHTGSEPNAKGMKLFKTVTSTLGPNNRVVDVTTEVGLGAGPTETDRDENPVLLDADLAAAATDGEPLVIHRS